MKFKTLMRNVFFFFPPFPLLISFPFSFLKSNQRKGKSQRLKLCFFMCHSHWFPTILLCGELLGSLFYIVRYGKLLMESCCLGMGTSKSILRDRQSQFVPPNKKLVFCILITTKDYGTWLITLGLLAFITMLITCNN